MRKLYYSFSLKFIGAAPNFISADSNLGLLLIKIYTRKKRIEAFRLISNLII